MAHVKILLLGALMASAAADYSGGVGTTYGVPSGGGDFGGGYPSYSSGGDFGHGGGGSYSSGGGGGGYGGGHHEEHHEAKPYEFGYSVKDHHHGTDFGQQESSDGHNVKGQYRVVLPDGRTQIVTYHADWKTGFHADVKYEGEAHYPEPTGHGHGHGGGGGGNGGGYQYPDPHEFTQADFGHSTGGYKR
ncbi:pro-resilin-like [Cimex lectularius]|uniref:CPR type cuticle protein n=1 Tax=Cimex lectularius TaxID=79782 RepID=A0A8I6TEL2_CIMLE|nr:pro-resilin-like [Cimex lectularius]